MQCHLSLTTAGHSTRERWGERYNKSMRLNYEPASDPPQISEKKLFLSSDCFCKSSCFCQVADLKFRCATSRSLKERSQTRLQFAKSRTCGIGWSYVCACTVRRPSDRVMRGPCLSIGALPRYSSGKLPVFSHVATELKRAVLHGRIAHAIVNHFGLSRICVGISVTRNLEP